MTYREYFEEHENENIGWCKPYFDESEEYCIVMGGGSVASIDTPDERIIRGLDPNRTLDEAITKIAKAINPDYDLYSGWPDIIIALETMHKGGCASCPFKDDCDVMGEEMEETDWRGE